MHKHIATENGSMYSRCRECLVPMVEVVVRDGPRVIRRFWRASDTVRNRILAGPVWEYLNDHDEELAGINAVATRI